jgi:hypothetical protein
LHDSAAAGVPVHGPSPLSEHERVPVHFPKSFASRHVVSACCSTAIGEHAHSPLSGVQNPVLSGVQNPP